MQIFYILDFSYFLPLAELTSEKMKNNLKILLILLIAIKLSTQNPTQLEDFSSFDDVTESANLNESDFQDDETEKGIFDGVLGSSASSTTAKPTAGGGLGGLGGLPNLGSISNAGPLLILGGFQAIVTKFDPTSISGLPGIGGLGNILQPSKK